MTRKLRAKPRPAGNRKMRELRREVGRIKDRQDRDAALIAKDSTDIVPAIEVRTPLASSDYKDIGESALSAVCNVSNERYIRAGILFVEFAVHQGIESLSPDYKLPRKSMVQRVKSRLGEEGQPNKNVDVLSARDTAKGALDNATVSVTGGEYSAFPVDM